MDELAVALKVDPVELRLRYYSDRDQTDDLPFTSKKLRECYEQGAKAFGWDQRKAESRSMRDGSELVGWGMATGVWEALQMKTTVRVVLTANGHAEVSCATSDIGTGTYTIMAQVAADMLGVPLENVTVKLGHRRYRNRRSRAGRGRRRPSRTPSSTPRAIFGRRCFVWRPGCQIRSSPARRRTVFRSATAALS